MDTELERLANLTVVAQQRVSKVKKGLEAVRDIDVLPTRQLRRDQARTLMNLAGVMAAGAVSGLIVGILNMAGVISDRLFDAVYLGYLGFFIVPFLMYMVRLAPSLKNTGLRPYRGSSVLSLREEITQAEEAVAAADEWATRVDAGTLSEPGKAAELAEQGEGLTTRLGGLTARVYMLGSFAAMIQAKGVISRGRWRGAHMKSTAVSWSGLDERLRSIGGRHDSDLSGDPAADVDSYMGTFRDARAMLVDGLENIKDSRHGTVVWVVATCLGVAGVLIGLLR